MANVKKFTRNATGHLCLHFERAKDINGEYVKFGNQQIDFARTNLNYNLAPHHEQGQNGFIQNRCSEVQCMNRKDVNVMCSWTVTAPKNLPKEDEKRFFDATYHFLIERYGGEQNVISAYVHMDEVTPHMHFAFVPVTFDERKEVYKVSAKEVIDRNDLRTFHGDLENHLANVFERELCILNDATKDGNKSIEELKRLSAVEELPKLTYKLEHAQALLRQAVLEEERTQVKINANKVISMTVHEIRDMGKMNLSKTKVTFSRKDADYLKTRTIASFGAESQAERAKKDMLDYKAYNNFYKSLDEEYEKLQEDFLDLKFDYQKLEKELNRVNKILEKNPEIKNLFLESQEKNQSKNDWELGR